MYCLYVPTHLAIISSSFVGRNSAFIIVLVYNIGASIFLTTKKFACSHLIFFNENHWPCLFFILQPDVFEVSLYKQPTFYYKHFEYNKQRDRTLIATELLTTPHYNISRNLLTYLVSSPCGIIYLTKIFSQFTLKS